VSLVDLIQSRCTAGHQRGAEVASPISPGRACPGRRGNTHGGRDDDRKFSRGLVRLKKSAGRWRRLRPATKRIGSLFASNASTKTLPIFFVTLRIDRAPERRRRPRARETALSSKRTRCDRSVNSSDVPQHERARDDMPVLIATSFFVRTIRPPRRFARAPGGEQCGRRRSSRRSA
jgi:hypothetical protein